MSERFAIFKGETGPSIRMTITLGGSPVTLTTPPDTVRFQGRLSGSTSPTLDVDGAAVIEDAPNGVVRYEWAAGDTAAAGYLVAWWLVTTGGEAQSTPAFVVPIIDHAADPGASGSYASVLDVKAAGGVLSRAWTQTSDVSENDLATFLELAAGDVDVALAIAGATLPLTDPVPIAGLRSIVVDGALVRAIDATWPKGAPQGAIQLRDGAFARWTLALRSLVDGSSLVVRLIEQSDAAISGQASSLWTDEATYGMWSTDWRFLPSSYYGANLDAADLNPYLAPVFARADVL